MRLDDILDDIISFSGKYGSYCVGMVDIVNSTKVTASLPKTQICQYYGIFLNTMAAIARKFGATVVKNVGDSLLYYFPLTSDISSKSSFGDVLECGMAMLGARLAINTKMSLQKLPPLSYRVSADYGIVATAESPSVQGVDIFGPTVNICTKINRDARPDSMVIGGDLYQIVKSFSEYEFKLIIGYSAGLKLQYPVYSIARRKPDYPSF